ncbi:MULTISPECIES: FMN reductase [Streptomyces]|uniref:FMN reductase n=1 Tax=Streptomyces TaxID=1883 RepID=UPI00093A490B|nr:MULTISPECIES: FMN reductase [Streptomyces]MBX9424269.1 FMN reductase [Streptomyces lateritius]OKJ66903.1 oxidoreductase [Streptomyces sp. CB02261]
MQTLKLVAVSAGLSSPSSTRLLTDRLLRAARYRLAEQEYAVDVQVVELRDLAVDIAKNFVTGFPSGQLREAIDAVTGADGVVAVTPVFTASYSGLFKSFFDLIDPAALAGTPVLLGATGGTARHSLVLDHALRPLFAYLRALVAPTAVYAASEDWGSGADQAAPAGHGDGLSSRIDRAGREFADMVAARPGRRDDEDEIVPFERQLADLRLD